MSVTAEHIESAATALKLDPDVLRRLTEPSQSRTIPVRLHRRGIKVRVTRRGIEAKTHLGRHRQVAERTISWVLRFKHLGLRYDRTETTVLPLLLFAVTLINLRRLRQATKL